MGLAQWRTGTWWLCLLLIGFIDFFQQRHTIRRLYPAIGGFRYLVEAVRAEIQQNFVESETNGMPPTVNSAH